MTLSIWRTRQKSFTFHLGVGAKPCGPLAKMQRLSKDHIQHTIENLSLSTKIRFLTDRRTLVHYTHNILAYSMMLLN